MTVRSELIGNVLDDLVRLELTEEDFKENETFEQNPGIDGDLLSLLVEPDSEQVLQEVVSYEEIYYARRVLDIIDKYQIDRQCAKEAIVLKDKYPLSEIHAVRLANSFKNDIYRLHDVLTSINEKISLPASHTTTLELIRKVLTAADEKTVKNDVVLGTDPFYIQNSARVNELLGEIKFAKKIRNGRVYAFSLEELEQKHSFNIAYTEDENNAPLSCIDNL